MDSRGVSFAHANIHRGRGASKKNKAPQTATPTWSISETDDFTTAEATCELANKLLMTWIVELPKEGQLFRLHVRLTNTGKRAQVVESFPSWLASWDVAGQSQWTRWWKS